MRSGLSEAEASMTWSEAPTRILHEAAMKMPLNPRQSMATGENSKSTNCHLSARRLLASSFSAMTAFCRQIHAISMNMPEKCVSQKNSRARSSTLHAICGLRP